MPTPDTTATDPKIPGWLESARRFYGDGFEVRTPKALAASNADWGDLPEHERSFALAHLLYLNLIAQRGTQRLLAEVRDLLEEVAEGLAVGGEKEDDGDGDGDDSTVETTAEAVQAATPAVGNDRATDREVAPERGHLLRGPPRQADRRSGPGHSRTADRRRRRPRGRPYRQPPWPSPTARGSPSRWARAGRSGSGTTLGP